MRSSAIISIGKNAKYCFFRSKWAQLHPRDISHPTSVKYYRQYFNGFNIQCFDFKKGFKCSKVHDFENLKTYSNNTFELNFFQDQNNRKHNLIPIEISKIDESGTVVDLLFQKK